MSQKRPHIIIFNPDEMRADALHHLGKNQAAVTPNLDKFVQSDAVSFENAFCQNPVCVPSRCSFFTGLYPHTTGHRTMTYLLRPGETSMFKELKDAGYYVWMNNRNDLYAGQYSGWMESNADEIFYPEEGSRAPKAMNENQRGEEGGKYYYSHYEGQLNVDENGKNYTSDDETIDAAIDKIKNWKDEKQPLCMFLGLFYPHPPYQVEEPYFSAIDRSKLPDRIRFEDCIDKSKMLKQYHEYQNLEGLNEDEWDEIRATYAGMCMKVDEQFGKLVQALKDVGIYDDCAIFVMSDHGDFVGDYGMAEKAQSSFEDCLTKVPFLVKPPKNIPVDAGVSDSMVELVDFYATVMDFAEVVPSHEHFGRSLRGAVIDRSKQVREFSCCEGGRRQGELQCDEYHQPGGRTAQPADVYWPKKMAQADDEAHAKATMLRTKSFKYVSRITGEDELYDLKNDPQEKINQINNIEYKEILLQLKDKLLRWMQETSDIVPFDYDSRMNETMLWNLVKRMVPADKEDDVRGKIRSGISIGALFGYCKSMR